LPKYLFKTLAAPALLSPLLSAGKKDTVGGQALIEGVMMRGKEKVSWAVRRPDGETVVERFPFVSVTKRNFFCGIPVIRGVINLFESLGWGFKALSRSADIAIDETETEDGGGVNAKALSAGGEAKSADGTALSVDGGGSSPDPEASAASPKKPSAKDQFFNAMTMVAAFAISIALFIYAPMWIANRLPAVKDSPMLFNLTAGAVRIALFLLYVYLISLWSEMRRVFEYHGAEHKAIFAYEDGKPLTPDSIEPYPTVHPRCGTSFLILVAICSILLFSVIDTLYIQYFGEFVNVPHRFAVHLVLMPLVAGTSYEALKLSDRFQKFPVVGWIIKPGLWLQRITTRKPDGSQIEVAIKALEAAL
jgi:uncharacterized protein YqhQ